MSQSKVVHCRIPLETLAHCIVLLKEMDVSTENVALSTIVVEALNGLTAGLVRQGLLKEFKDRGAVMEVIDTVTSVLALPTGKPIADDFKTADTELHMADIPMAPRMLEGIENILNASPEATIIPKVEQSTEVVPEAVPVTISLYEQPRMDWDDILVECDIDDLLVSSVEDNPIGKIALGVVYKNLSRQMWNSETASNLLIKLIQDANNG